MAMPSSSATQNSKVLLQKNESKEVDDNSVPLGGQNDSKTGTTCHQCRQKKLNFAASCTNLKKNRVCAIKICKNCLFNRYGEEANEVGDWICPKCRGICNCSVCMKKKGQMPTGQLAQHAKAKGFSSVSEMLSVQGPENLGLNKDTASDKEPHATSEGGEQENNDDGKAKAKVKTVRVRCGPKQCTENTESEEVDLDLALPQGTPLTTVAGIQLAPEDVGNALQFLKFFETFGEVLDFNKSQAENVLREISRQGSGRPGQYSSVIQFHIHFLSFIQADMEDESPSTSNQHTWFQDLGKCISESGISHHVLKEMPSGCFSRGGEGYDRLTFSQKLRLLNFLCDEALETSTLRSWINEQHEISAQSEKETRKKVAAAKNKEKLLKKKLKDEKEKRKCIDNDDPVSIVAHESIVSQIESEAAQAEGEVAEAMAMVPQSKAKVLRTEPYLLDADGRAFWKLKGYTSEEAVLLQDMGTRDAAPSSEKWFVYDAEMKEPIEKYFSSLSLREKKGARRKRRSETPPKSDEEDIAESRG